jgi:hypothetical protein
MPSLVDKRATAGRGWRVRDRAQAHAAAPESPALTAVSVRCTLGPGDQLLEGLVSVSQEQAFGSSSLNPTCDGKRDRIDVQLPTMGQLFEPGAASASAFLLFLDPESGMTVSAQDSRTIKLHGS